jgi:hypothetical protein
MLKRRWTRRDRHNQIQFSADNSPNTLTGPERMLIVLESIIINANKGGWLGTRLLNHIHHFLRSSRLNWLARLNLVFSYLTRRFVKKIKSRCRVRKRASASLWLVA